MKSARRVCVMGVAGAGKTVVGMLLADALGVEFLEGDALHSPENVRRMAQGIALTDADRRGWLESIAGHIAEARSNGRGLVVACSALKRAYRDVLRGADGELRFVHLTGDAGVIRQRMSQRVGHYMPASLLDSQLATLEVPAVDEHVWTCDIADPPQAIVLHLLERLAA